MQANPVEAALIPGVNGAGYLEDGAYFIERDHHSNVIAITDDQGGQLTNIAYTPYGEIDQANSWGKDIYSVKFDGYKLDYIGKDSLTGQVVSIY
ncbi:MAG: hypothetical protein J0G29_07770, partial [Alphaproteobacteria bacterium]|nr:hypothetical protein [Alphaproteobacteria bacterium]